MKKNIFFLLGLICLSFASCEKAFMESDYPTDAVSSFEYLWNRVDQQYSFFDVKGVDWNVVHDTYRPMVYEGMSDDSLFRVCAAMLNTLQDGHTNLVSGFDTSMNDSVYYRMNANKNINESVVLLNYLTVNHHQIEGFHHNAIRNGKVAYIRYSSFANMISEDAMKYLVKQYEDCDGMIIDVRQNTGGYISCVPTMLSIFDNHGQPLYTTQVKSGPGHNDFTEMQTVMAADSSVLGKDYYNKPVAMLIDRGTFSATSFLSICTQGYDNIKLFGDYSGGGLGLPNGGQMPNGWFYRFSISRTIAIDGGNYENGVPPDVRVILDPACTAQGVDNVIEAAANWIQGIN